VLVDGCARVLGAELSADEAAVDRLAEHRRLPQRERLEPAERLDVAPSVPAIVTDDVESGRNMLKEYYSFYIGGMGARTQNFYNDLFTRYGYEAEAREIQDLFLDGKQREAAAKVPDAFVDEVALIGSVERIRDRLAAWRESGATTLLVSTRDAATLRGVAEAAS